MAEGKKESSGYPDSCASIQKGRHAEGARAGDSAETAFLDRDSIGKTRLAVKEVEVQEWGMRVFLRELSGNDRKEFETLCQEWTKDSSRPFSAAELNVRILAWGCCDPHGRRVFDITKDEGMLMSLSATVVSRLAGIIQEISGLSTRDSKKN
jgi:hypothetical protein